MDVLRILKVWFCVAVLSTVVIGGVWLFSARAAHIERGEWAACVLNIRNVQQAVRGHQGVENLNFGAPLDSSFLAKYLRKPPVCPAGGTYTFKTEVPEFGVLYCTCSHAVRKGHEPDDYSDW